MPPQPAIRNSRHAQDCVIHGNGIHRAGEPQCGRRSTAGGEGYPSDLRDAEWARLEPLIPGATPGGQRRKTDMRAAMRRRDFYSTFAFGAILTPLAARAQQKASR